MCLHIFQPLILFATLHFFYGFGIFAKANMLKIFHFNRATVLALIIKASLGSYIRANCKVGINPGIPKRSLTLISCLSHQDGLGSEAIIQ